MFRGPRLEVRHYLEAIRQALNSRSTNSSEFIRLGGSAVISLVQCCNAGRLDAAGSLDKKLLVGDRVASFHIISSIQKDGQTRREALA